MANDFTVEAWLWIDSLAPYSKVILITGDDKNFKNGIGWGLGARCRHNDRGAKTRLACTLPPVRFGTSISRSLPAKRS